MKKRSMHRLHLSDGIWKWYVNSNRHNRHNRLVLFDPNGKRMEVKATDFMNLKPFDEDEAGDMVTYTPAGVREYILKNISG